MQVDNKYKVPQKLWRKFRTEYARRTYNAVMEQSINNQEITAHPKMPVMPQEQWNTICHNFACFAAWSVSDEKLEAGTEVIDEDSKGNVVRKHKAK